LASTSRPQNSTKLTAHSCLELSLDLNCWPLTQPFRTAGTLESETSTLTVTVQRAGLRGQGEASGVYYFGETPNLMRDQIEAVRDEIEAGIDRARLSNLLPMGGARNALDCALWALEALEEGRPVWQLAGLKPPRPRITTITIGADTPWKLARTAASWREFSAIKLKLLGDGHDADRVKAVREVRPDAWLGVDANQSLGRAGLEAILPTCIDMAVSVIEQPVSAGADQSLSGLSSPILLAADESVGRIEELSYLKEIYGAVSIKLDKTGGLTYALELAHAARALGFQVMVGNMLGTSLAMAPAFLVAQLCDIVDLDGPLLLARERDDHATYQGGMIDCSRMVWGT